METNIKGKAAGDKAGGENGKVNTPTPAPARDVKITEDPKNYRRHNARNLSLIEKSLTDCGAGRSIVADSAGVVIGGNGTLRMAKKRGIRQKIVHTNGDELVVVVRDDISPNDPRRKELALADNATSDSSDFDFEKLKTEFTAAELSDWDVAPVDFSGAAGGDGRVGPEALGEFDDSGLPEELQGENLEPNELNKIESDYQTERGRIIITFPWDKQEALMRMLGLTSLDKVVYSAEEILGE